MNDSNLDDWISVVDAAALRGTHRNSILKAIRRGTLPAEKKGGRWLLKREVVVSWKPIGHRPAKRKEIEE